MTYFPSDYSGIAPTESLVVQVLREYYFGTRPFGYNFEHECCQYFTPQNTRCLVGTFLPPSLRTEGLSGFYIEGIGILQFHKYSETKHLTRYCSAKFLRWAQSFHDELANSQIRLWAPITGIEILRLMRAIATTESGRNAITALILDIQRDSNNENY